MAATYMCALTDNIPFKAPTCMLLICGRVSTWPAAHGVRRWAELQHTKDIKVTRDAVAGPVLRMKRKRVEIPHGRLFELA